MTPKQTMRDIDVDAHITPHPLADKGLIPEEHWLPMIPFDISEWGDASPGGDLFTPAETRAWIRANEKEHGLDPLDDDEVERRIHLT